MITYDTLKLVTEQLSPPSRLNMAAIYQRCFDLATKWHDVKTILFDGENVTMVGANFVHTFQNSSFDGANNNKSKLSDVEAQRLNQLNLKLTKLYISNENLGLRTLHLVVDCNKKPKIVDVVEPRVLTACFPQTLTRVCLTGIYLTESLIDHMVSLKNLASLDMVGCLVDTRAGAKYVPKLEQMKNLDDLSIPPSMFSLTSTAKTSVDFNFRQLTVSKISIFMDQFEDVTFYDQIRHFLPKNLQCLVIFGNYGPLKKKNRLNAVKNFVILLGPNAPLSSCPKENLANVTILSHLVRRPPYIPTTNSSNFLRRHDVSVGNLSWQFSLVEWKNNNGAKKDVMALRTRLNAAPNEDLVFEGVVIAPPVIRERLRENRRMPMQHLVLPVTPPFDEPDDPAPPLPVAPPPLHGPNNNGNGPAQNGN